MARPRLKIDPIQVRKLAEYGTKVQEMGHFFDCDPQTITNRFSDELEKGRANLKISLRRKQIQIALTGNVTMLIWLGKQLLDQKDRAQYDLKEIDDETFTAEAKRRLSELKAA